MRIYCKVVTAQGQSELELELNKCFCLLQKQGAKGFNMDVVLNKYDEGHPSESGSYFVVIITYNMEPDE